MDLTALFSLSYGLYIVGAKDDDRNVGCVVNAVVQVSNDPHSLVLSINKKNFTTECILKSNKFSLSILSEEIDKRVIGDFGFFSSKDKNKFEKVNFFDTTSGLPVLKDGTSAYIECKVVNTMDCYSHILIFADIVDCQNISEQKPLTYDYYHRVLKGTAPKTAPTYIDKTKQ